MHPDISRLPSRVFYGNRLLDGPDMEAKTKQPWHTNKKFGTYKFFNVSGIEISSGHSIKNQSECNVAAALFNRLRHDFTSVNFDFRIGVVSMYRAQIMELKRLFEQRFGKELVGKIDFNTVDGFQGQEKDVIILSCVRAGPGLQSVGFLSGVYFAIRSFNDYVLIVQTDTRRMNVALTRAKSSLFILGNAPTLERSDGTWRQIIEDARSSSSLVNVIISLRVICSLYSYNFRLTLAISQERYLQRQQLLHSRKNHEQLLHQYQYHRTWPHPSNLRLPPIGAHLSLQARQFLALLFPQ